jgi:hypothetical protein
MTSETIKILLMILLWGGLRTAIFVMEKPSSRAWSLYQALLEWVTMAVWPAVPAPRRVIVKRDAQRRRGAATLLAARPRPMTKQASLKLERVKRADSNYPIGFSIAYHALRPAASYYVGRSVGRFIVRS